MRSADDRRRANARGRAAEDLVCDELEAGGWSILARNWHCKGGELDLVAQRGGSLRMVEVRARAEGLVDAEDSIGHRKRRRLRHAAESFLQTHRGSFDEVAFLVAVVDLEAEPWCVTWYDDAFDGA
jgi:putative endonuclease